MCVYNSIDKRDINRTNDTARERERERERERGLNKFIEQLSEWFHRSPSKLQAGHCKAQ